MKVRLLESENTRDSFDRVFNKILNAELQELNNYLDKWGFEVELVDDYDDEDSELYKNSVGIFCTELQDNASVFPVYINKDAIYNYLSEEGLEDDITEIRLAIEGTLWHEAGHGLIYYMADRFEFDDEEETAEDFAVNKNNSELVDALEEYIEEMC